MRLFRDISEFNSGLTQKKKGGRGESKEGKKKWTEREEENGMPEKEERKNEKP